MWCHWCRGSLSGRRETVRCSAYCTMTCTLSQVPLIMGNVRVTPHSHAARVPSCPLGKEGLSGRTPGRLHHLPGSRCPPHQPCGPRCPALERHTLVGLALQGLCSLDYPHGPLKVWRRNVPHAHNFALAVPCRPGLRPPEETSQSDQTKAIVHCGWQALGCCDHRPYMRARS